jgi:L-amino acid N-acyltransferase YncA
MIRQADINDIEAITDIYNHAVDARFQTAYTERHTIDDSARWFNEHDTDNYPVFVYGLDGQVAGWLSVSPYRQGRAALRYAVEVSYFIHKDHQGKGIGTQLLSHAIKACTELGYKTVLAIILEPNKASARLLERSGFEKWAYLPAIADFDGVECSQVYYGLKL